MQSDTHTNQQDLQNPYPNQQQVQYQTVSSPPQGQQIPLQQNQPNQQNYQNAQQPYPAQPYLNQPYQAQNAPYPTQPYPGQPYQGQPYQQSPYPIIGGPQQPMTVGQPIYIPQQQQPIYHQSHHHHDSDVGIIGQTPIIYGDPKHLPFDANMKQFPTEIICPKCKNRIITVITHEFGAGTFTMSYLLLLLTGQLIMCCCWLPYCMIDCQDKIHKCPHCMNVVGIKPYQLC